MKKVPYDKLEEGKYYHQTSETMDVKYYGSSRRTYNNLVLVTTRDRNISDDCLSLNWVRAKICNLDKKNDQLSHVDIGINCDADYRELSEEELCLLFLGVAQ